MDKITDLSQTVELMLSEDYKDRFIAEYAQLLIRVNKLDRVLSRIADNSAPDCFEPTCNVEILKSQWKSMNAYLAALIMRSALEGIELPEVEI